MTSALPQPRPARPLPRPVHAGFPLFAGHRVPSSSIAKECTMFEKDIAMNASPAASAARRAPRWRGVARAGIAVAAQGTLAGALMLAGSPAFAAAGHHAAPHAMVFASVVNPADPTFNQLLGINSHNVIAGYFGV